MGKRILVDEDGDALIECPGCKMRHMIPTGCNESPRWNFDGNEERPTLTPSIRIQSGRGFKHVCHFFVRNGNIEFCGDSTHALAGTTHELQEIRRP